MAQKFNISPDHLQNVFQYLDSAIMVVDVEEKFVAWNNGAQKVFGYSFEEIIGKNSSALLPSGAKYIVELNQIINEVKEKGFAKLIETERKTKEGRVIPVHLNVAKLPGENNEYLGRTIVISDVTEVRRLQQ